VIRLAAVHKEVEQRLLQLDAVSMQIHDTSVPFQHASLPIAQW
jgi:hypothetical protein